MQAYGSTPIFDDAYEFRWEVSDFGNVFGEVRRRSDLKVVIPRQQWVAEDPSDDDLLDEIESMLIDMDVVKRLVSRT